MLKLISLLLLMSAASGVHANTCVVLLHGLARTSDSMEKMADALTGAKFTAVNIDYESRSATISVLAHDAVSRGLDACRKQQSDNINFVTHSLGGILVRQYLSEFHIENLGRVVMLAPPNKGSEVVDELMSVPGFALLNGPAGQQLGSGADSVPNSLGPVNFDLGVIAGTETFNPMLSQLLPNPDDGKVSLESTKVEGMCGFLAVPSSHTFIMRSDLVIEQVIDYLQTGQFSHKDALRFDCH